MQLSSSPKLLEEQPQFAFDSVGFSWCPFVWFFFSIKLINKVIQFNFVFYGNQVKEFF